MSSLNLYKTDITTAVKFFRPVLAALNIRNKDKQEKVFLASFDNLEFLNLDNCVVTVLTAKLDNACGLFFCRLTSTGLIDCYIVLNDSLYSESNLEKVKINGVHEFCHFLAIVYSLTATTIDAQRKYLVSRMEKKMQRA